MKSTLSDGSKKTNREIEAASPTGFKASILNFFLK